MWCWTWQSYALYNLVFCLYCLLKADDILQMQVEALPSSIAQVMMEKHLSSTSFVSANDSMNNSPSIQSRRLRPGTYTAGSSFDSYT